MTTPVAATPAMPATPMIFHRRRTSRVGYPGVEYPTLTLDEAVEIAATGDIWLFRGRSAADLAIRALTNSPVNHVGMVVAIDDLPPLLWHAELGRSLPDVWTGQRQRGVQLHHLPEAVTTWNERYNQRAWVRQLKGTIERHHEDRLMEIIARFDGRAFPTTPGLIRQWAKARLRRTPSLETIYCAELVATTYQHMGLLPSAVARTPSTRPHPQRLRVPARRRRLTTTTTLLGVPLESPA